MSADALISVFFSTGIVLIGRDDLDGVEPHFPRLMLNA